MTMDDTKLYEFVAKESFLTPVPYIFGADIYEYDLKQANIHALYCAGKINMQDFAYLSMMPKEMREKEIGLRIREDNSLLVAIKENIAYAKCQFVKINNIDPFRIIRIANDSLYIVTSIVPQNTIIQKDNGYMEFVCKNHFTTYMKLNKPMLFFFDSSKDFWNIDVKGINKNKLPLHEPLLTAICNIVDARVNGGKDIAIVQFNNFYRDYIGLDLPVEYYREFNAESMFRLRNTQIENFLLNDSTMLSPRDLRIEYNQNLLRKIYSYILES